MSKADLLLFIELLEEKIKDLNQTITLLEISKDLNDNHKRIKMQIDSTKKQLKHYKITKLRIEKILK